MSEIANSVFNAVTDFAEGNLRSRIFVTPDISAEKLENARSQFITRNEPKVACDIADFLSSDHVNPIRQFLMGNVAMPQRYLGKQNFSGIMGRGRRR